MMRDGKQLNFLAVFLVVWITVEPAFAEQAGEFSSPQATFETAKRSLARRDYDKFCECFTYDGLRLLAGSLRMVSGMMIMTGQQPGADVKHIRLSKGITRINQRYVSKVSEPGIQLNFNASSEEMMTGMRSLADPIKNKSGYVGGLLKLLAANEDRPGISSPLGDAELKGLVVEQTTARAVMHGTFLKPSKSEEPIVFLRDGSAWKIEQIGKYGTSIKTKQKSKNVKLQRNPMANATVKIERTEPSVRPKKPLQVKQLTLPPVEVLKTIDRPDKEGFAKLHRAAMGRDLNKVQELLAQGANVDIRQRKFHGTPLQYAANFGRLESVRLLLKFKATVDAKDTKGRTPLMWAATKGRMEVVKELLDAGANVNGVTHTGWTALHYAADKQHAEAVKILINRGASLTLKNSQGKTPADLFPDISKIQ